MEPEITIAIQRTKDLPPALRQQIDMLTHQEFGHLDIVRRYKWAEPDWMAVARRGREIVSFVGIVNKRVLFDAEAVKVAGLSNAVTPAEHRHKGYATSVLEEVYRFMFNELKAECGLLLCRDHLVPYYEHAGWYVVGCSLQFNKPDGSKETWQANTMLHTGTAGQFTPTAIDLQGYPW